MTGTISTGRAFGRWLAAGTAGLLLSTIGSVARAADGPQYGLVVEAERAGEQLLQVAVRVTETGADGKIETLSAPRLLILDGRRGLVVVEVGAKASPPLQEVRPNPAAAADKRAKAPESQPVGGAEDLSSGLRVDVISVKGKDEVLVIATAVEDGATVWGEVQKVPVRPRPEDRK